MRTGEAQHHQQRYLAGAHSGAQALAHMHQNVMQVFPSPQQDVLAAFLAALHVREQAHERHQHSAGQ
jgi:hypothetical protein